MIVFEIDHASKSMRKRQDKLRAQLQPRQSRTKAKSSGDPMRFTRSHTWQGTVRPLYCYNGATLTPFVGGGTVRRNSGGKRPEKRSGYTGNVIAFGSEGDGRVGGNTFRSSDDVVRVAQRRKIFENMVPLAVCIVFQRAPLASNIFRKSHMIGWCNWASLIKRFTNKGVRRTKRGTYYFH